MNAIAHPEAQTLAKAFAGNVLELDPSTNTRRDAYSHEVDQDLTAALLASNFFAAALRGDLKAAAPFAPKTSDFVNGREVKRAQTVGEMMDGSLDYGSTPDDQNPPNTLDLLEFLSASARGGSLPARALLKRMADTWAYHNSGEA